MKNLFFMPDSQAHMWRQHAIPAYRSINAKIRTKHPWAPSSVAHRRHQQHTLNGKAFWHTAMIWIPFFLFHQPHSLYVFFFKNLFFLANYSHRWKDGLTKTIVLLRRCVYKSIDSPVPLWHSHICFAVSVFHTNVTAKLMHSEIPLEHKHACTLSDTRTHTHVR